MRIPTLCILSSLALAACDPDPGIDFTADTIDQGWNNSDRLLFWHMPQGSYVVPYDWFLALENTTGKRITDRLGDMGYLPGAFHEELNPNTLPIGFTVERPTDTHRAVFGFQENWLGLTCSACHVGAIEVGDKTVIIDGGAAQGDMQTLVFAISDDLHATLNDGERFVAFAARLGIEDADQQVALRAKVEGFLQQFDGYKNRSFHDVDGSATNPGPGRVDAFGVILNEVSSFATGIAANKQTPTAPVSYPFVWGSPRLDWVQYNGVSQNAFTRNIGEVLGVFGRIQMDPRNQDTYLASTVRFDELQKIESTLRKLKEPSWELVFGEKPKETVRGEELYNLHCEGCHLREPVLVPNQFGGCLLYTSPSPRDATLSRMPSSA